MLTLGHGLCNALKGKQCRMLLDQKHKDQKHSPVELWTDLPILSISYALVLHV